MPDCPASDQSSTGMKKLTMPGMVRYRTKPSQSGIFLVRYQTEIIDAGMPIAGLVSLMPMPSYASRIFTLFSKLETNSLLFCSNLKRLQTTSLPVTLGVPDI
jgi:hypothetical protein